MSSDGLVFFYGDYSHPAGECYPRSITITPEQSGQGFRWASNVRLTVSGHFVDINPELDAAGVNDRIEELEQVYKYDYKDCGFRLPNGNLTEHYLLTDDAANLSGNKIIQRSWDHDPIKAEFANTRSFSVTIGAKILQTYGNVLYFSETVTRIGTGGPVWKIFQSWDGTPYKEEIHDLSKVTHIQSGIIIGLNGYLQKPLPLWPDEEQEWRRRSIDFSPRYHGDMEFLKGTHYGTRYAYFFERLGPDPLRPNNWLYGG